MPRPHALSADYRQIEAEGKRQQTGNSLGSASRQGGHAEVPRVLVNSLDARLPKAPKRDYRAIELQIAEADCFSQLKISRVLHEPKCDG